MIVKVLKFEVKSSDLKQVGLPHPSDYTEIGESSTIVFVDGAAWVTAGQLAGLKEFYPKQVIATGTKKLFEIEVADPEPEPTPEDAE